MDKIDKILKIVVNQKGLRGATDAAQVCYLASEWGNGRFEAISYSRGTLKLGAKNHCQAQECQMLEEDLLEHLKEVADVQVSRVRWEVSSKKPELL